MIRLTESKIDVDSWSILHVFGNEMRIEILKLLLRHEMACLTDITRNLERNLRKKMTLPAVLKHMRILEKAGLVRLEPGIYPDKPDARKTLYMLEGRERILKILEQLEGNVRSRLIAGAVFHRTARLARSAQHMGLRYAGVNERHLESLLSECERGEIFDFLTEDEKKKVKLWRMMISVLK